MERNLQEIIKQMTLEEKAALCSGKDFWNTESIDRLGIPSIMMTDGPHGLRKQEGSADHLGINKSIPATCFPPEVDLPHRGIVNLPIQWEKPSDKKHKPRIFRLFWGLV